MRKILPSILFVMCCFVLQAQNRTIGGQFKAYPSGTVLNSTDMDKVSSSVQNVGIGKKQLKLSFNTGDLHQLYGEDKFSWEAKLVLEVEYEKAALGPSSVVGSEEVTLVLNEKTPEQLVLVDVSPYYENANRINIRYISCDITKAIDITPDVIYDNLVIEDELQLEYLYDVKLNKTLIIINENDLSVSPCVGCTTSEEVSVVNFSWSLPSDLRFTSYDLQVLKVEAGQKLKADGTLAFDNTVDWSKAATIEVPVVIGQQPSYKMTLAEGTGYYLWRVRPIGNYYPEGRADFRNYGAWTKVSNGLEEALYTKKSNGLYIPSVTDAINPNPGSPTVINGSRFFYNQFNEDINWIYGKVLTEGGRQSETMTFANGLNQVQQTQTKLFSKDEVIGAQNVYDYSARPSLSVLPSPTGDNKLGYKKDLILNNQGDNVSAKDFDVQATLFPTQASESPIGSQSKANTYYSENNNDATQVMSSYVPDAKGFPYSRTMYYNDASGRVKQQSGPGETMSLQDITELNSTSHNAVVYYSSVTSDELQRVFGSEAPVTSDGAVYKVINVDPNGVISVSYITKSGEVIATCLDQSSTTDNLDDVGNEGGFRVTDKTGVTMFTPTNRVSISTKSFVNATPAEITLDVSYEITPATFKNIVDFDATSVGIKESLCQTCDYEIEIKVVNIEKPGEESVLRGYLKPSLLTQGDPDNDGNCLNVDTYDIGSAELDWTPNVGGGFGAASEVDGKMVRKISLPAGSYQIVKTVKVKNELSDDDRKDLERVLFSDRDNQPSEEQLSKGINYLEAYNYLLDKEAKTWTAKDNFCGEFEEPEIELDENFTCDGVPVYCDQTNHKEFLGGVVSTDPDDLLDNSTGLTYFTDLVYQLVELEQGKVNITKDDNTQELNYKAKIVNGGSGLLSNLYTDKAALSNLILKYETSVGCLELSKCYTEAQLSLDVNKTLIEEGNPALADDQQAVQNGSFNSDNSPAGMGYNDKLDALNGMFECASPGSGFDAQFYSGTNFNTYLGSEPVKGSAFNYGAGGPLGQTNNFSIRYESKLKIDKEGKYRFRFKSDDGVRFFIDGIQINIPDVNGYQAWGLHGANDVVFVSDESNVLSVGNHILTVEYYEGTGESSLEIKWKHSSDNGYSLIPSLNLQQPCKGYAGIRAYREIRDISMTADVYNVQIPTHEGDASTALTQSNLICLTTYFTDNIVHPTSMTSIGGKDYPDYVSTNLKDFVSTNTFDEAVEQACLCTRALRHGIEERTNATQDDDGLQDELEAKCEEACDNSEPVFQGAIDDFVYEANQQIQKYNNPTAMDLNTVEDGDADWKTFSNLFVGGESEDCYKNEMLAECKSRCKLSYLDDIKDDKVPDLDAVLAQQKAYKQVFNGTVSFAPLKDKLQSTYSYLSLDQGALPEETAQDVIDFIYESWSKAIVYRTSTSTWSARPSGVFQGISFSVPLDDAELSHYTKEFQTQIKEETRQITVEANVIWEKGTSNLTVDDEFYEINFVIKGSSEIASFAMALHEGAIPLGTIDKVNFLNLKTHIVDIKTQLVDLSIDQKGNLLAKTNPFLIAKNSAGTVVDYPLVYKNVSVNRISPILTLTVNGNTSTPAYTPTLERLNDQKLYKLTWQPIAFVKDNETTAEAIAAGINGKGLAYAEAIGDQVKIWLSRPIHEYKDEDDVATADIKRYALVDGGTIYQIDDQEEINFTHFNSLPDVANLQDWETILAKGVLASTSAQECPFGYVKTNSLLKTKIQTKTDYERELKKVIEEDFFPFLYEVIKENISHTDGYETSERLQNALVSDFAKDYIFTKSIGQLVFEGRVNIVKNKGELSIHGINIKSRVYSSGGGCSSLYGLSFFGEESLRNNIQLWDLTKLPGNIDVSRDLLSLDLFEKEGKYLYKYHLKNTTSPITTSYPNLDFQNNLGPTLRAPILFVISNLEGVITREDNLDESNKSFIDGFLDNILNTAPTTLICSPNVAICPTGTTPPTYTTQNTLNKNVLEQGLLETDKIIYSGVNLSKDKNYELSLSYEHSPKTFIDYTKGVTVFIDGIKADGSTVRLSSSIINDGSQTINGTINESISGQDIKDIEISFFAPTSLIIDPFVTGKVYNIGDEISYNGRVYRAKSWTNKAPGETSGAWEEIPYPAGSTLVWSSIEEYQGGTEVLYNGKKYVAAYWTKNDVPSTSSVWSEVLTTTGGDTTINWDNTKVYVAGDIVNYNGQTYKAKWWTKGNTPSDLGPWEIFNVTSSPSAPSSAPNFNPSNFFPKVTIKDVSLEEVSTTFKCTPIPPCSICMRWKETNSANLRIDQFSDKQVMGFEEITPITCESEIQDHKDNSKQVYLDNCLKTSKAQLLSQYEEGCMSKLSDKLSFSYTSGMHHHTLYYYDRAGNLVQTVPPEGVEYLSDTEVQNVETKREAGKLDEFTDNPDHRLATTYKYNSIKQLVSQNTPDGGTTEFWYNAAGQLVLSQDAQQKNDNKYSYTKYDHLGRIIEVGELSNYTPRYLDSEEQQITELWTNKEFPYIEGVVIGPISGPDYSRLSEVHKTVYTLPVRGITCNGKPQMHLRNRISHVFRDLDGNPTTIQDQTHTYYSYDPHGNVEWLIQELPEIGRKTIRYEYDLVSGNVNKVVYQEGTKEQFMHRYAYDEDNRIVTTETSTDGEIWTKEANYQYYLHGPLARTEIGHDKIQGSDYVYTIEGYLKAINQPELNVSNDPGKDGDHTDGFLKDEFGMELGYYQGDYTRAGSKLGTDADYDPYAKTAIKEEKSSLYNGNIAYWVSNTRAGMSSIPQSNGGAHKLPLHTYFYRYDKLNRIKHADFASFYDGRWNGVNGNANVLSKYDVSYSYDANGNITNLNRAGLVSTDDNNVTTKLQMDALSYKYLKNASGKIVSNQLQYVQDAIQNSNYGNDIESQNYGNYEYDAEGNLTKDLSEGLNITWNVLNKVERIRKFTKNSPFIASNLIEEIHFEYDAMGNRVGKETIKDGKVIKGTYYVTDASGNVMAIYEKNFIEDNNTETTEYKLNEYPIYGSERIGQYRPKDLVVASYDSYQDRNNTSIHNLSSTNNAQSKLLLPTNNGIKVVNQTPNGLSLGGEYFIDGNWVESAQWLDNDNEVLAGAMKNFQGEWYFFDGKYDESNVASTIIGLNQSNTSEVKGRSFFLPSPVNDKRYYFVYYALSGYKYVEIDVSTPGSPSIQSMENGLTTGIESYDQFMPVVFKDGNSRLFGYKTEGSTLTVSSLDLTSEGFSGIKDRISVDIGSSDNLGTGNLSLSPDGTTLAIANTTTSSSNADILLFDVELSSGKLSNYRSFKSDAIEGNVEQVAFETNDKLIHKGKSDGTVYSHASFEVSLSDFSESNGTIVLANSSIAPSVTGEVIFVRNPEQVQLNKSLDLGADLVTLPIQHYMSQDNLLTCDLSKTITSTHNNWIIPTEGTATGSGLGWEFQSNGAVQASNQFDSEVSLGANVAIAEDVEGNEVLRFMVTDKVETCPLEVPSYAQLNPDNLASGLKVSYYQGDYGSGGYDHYLNGIFTGSALLSVVEGEITTSLNITDVNSILPTSVIANDLYGLHIKGQIEIPADGEYTFYLDAVGSAQMRVSGTRHLGTYWGPGHSTFFTMNLTAGLHPIELLFNNESNTRDKIINGVPSLQLSWSYGTVSKQLIPAGVFKQGGTTSTPPAGGPRTVPYKKHGLLAEYFEAEFEEQVSLDGFADVARVEEQVNHVWSFYDKDVRVASRHTGYIKLPKPQNDQPLRLVVMTDKAFDNENVPRLWLGDNEVTLFANPKTQVLSEDLDDVGRTVEQVSYEASVRKELLDTEVKIRLEYKDVNNAPVILRLAWDYRSPNQAVIIPKKYLKPTMNACDKQEDIHGVRVEHYAAKSVIDGSHTLKLGENLKVGQGLIAGEYSFELRSGLISVFKGEHISGASLEAPVGDYGLFFLKSGTSKFLAVFDRVANVPFVGTDGKAVRIDLHSSTEKVVLHEDGQLLAHGTSGNVVQKIYGHTLYTGTFAGCGDILENGEYKLDIQCNNALVLSNNVGNIWSSGNGYSGVGSERLVMQTDGNLVFYNPPYNHWRHARWSSKTDHGSNSDYKVRVFQNGDFAILNSNNDDVKTIHSANNGVPRESILSLTHQNETQFTERIKSTITSQTPEKTWVSTNISNRYNQLAPHPELSNEYYVTHSTTYLYLDELGQFNFEVVADGLVTIDLDNHQLLGYNESEVRDLSVRTMYTPSLTLVEAGYHKFDVYHYHRRGTASVATIKMKTVSQSTYQAIPAERLFLEKPDGGKLYSEEGKQLLTGSIPADKDGSSIIVKASGANENYFVINTSREGGSGDDRTQSIHYTLVQANKEGAQVLDKVVLRNKEGFDKESIAFAAYNDDEKEENNKLFISQLEGGLIGTDLHILQYKIQEGGMSLDRRYDFPVEYCDQNNCSAFGFKAGTKVMQVSPQGDQLVMSYTAGNRALSSSSSNDRAVNKFLILDIIKDNSGVSLDINSLKVFNLTSFIPTNLSTANQDILSFDITMDGKYAYYLLSNTGTNTTELHRLNLSTGATEIIRDYTEVGAVTKGAVRRGKNGKMYITLKGGTILDELTHKESKASINHTGYTTAAQSGGLSLQPYKVSTGRCATTNKPTLYATRTVGDRMYECKDHLGNVRVVLKDVRVCTGSPAISNVITEEFTTNDDVDGVDDGIYNIRAGGTTNSALPFTPENTSPQVIVSTADGVTDVFGFAWLTLPELQGKTEEEKRAYLDNAFIKLCRRTASGNIDVNSIQTIKLSDPILRLIDRGHYLSGRRKINFKYDNAIGEEAIATITNFNDIPFGVDELSLKASKPMEDGYVTDVVSWTDYYPFGSPMPERNYPANSADNGGYRYGFNGKEKDDEVKGGGLQYDYGFRVYDARLGKFLSEDPLSASYPWYTPYQFAGNNPVWAIDLDGLEEDITIKDQYLEAKETFKVAQELKKSENITVDPQFMKQKQDELNHKKKIYDVALKIGQQDESSLPDIVMKNADLILKYKYINPYGNYSRKGDVTSQTKSTLTLDKVDWVSQFTLPRPNVACARTCQKILKEHGLSGSKASRYIVVKPKTQADKTTVLEVQSNAKEGVEHIDKQLDNGHPVMVGVNHTIGKTQSDGVESDHYVVINGRSYDSEKKQYYYTFIEVGTRHEFKGTSDKNRLYLQSDGSLKGENHDGKEYTVIDIRKK